MIRYFGRLPYYRPISRCESCVFNINGICNNSKCLQHFRGFTSAVCYCPDFLPSSYQAPLLIMWSLDKVIQYSSILGISIPSQLTLNFD